MKENLRFIKFFSITSVIAFACCYITNLMTFDAIWINSYFLFSIFSGVFASFVVVLITEIKKYFDNKTITENQMYTNCVGLYTELTVQIKQLDMYVKSKGDSFPKDILEYRMPVLDSYNNTLRVIDYTTMKKKNTLFLRFSSFIQQEVPKINCHMANCKNLQIAVTQTQLNHLQQGIPCYIPTTADPLVNIAVRKIEASAEARRVAVDGFLQTMVALYPNRFNWDKEKEAINQVSFDMQKMHQNSKEFFEN